VPVSTTVQVDPVTVAVANVAPPSNDTRTTWLAPSGALSVPETVRPAEPSAVM